MMEEQIHKRGVIAGRTAVGDDVQYMMTGRQSDDRDKEKIFSYLMIGLGCRD